MKLTLLGSAVLVCGFAGLAALPACAMAEKAADIGGVEPLSLNGSFSPGPDMASRAVADPVAVPLPTAAQSGMVVLAGAALWRGAKRVRAAV